MALVPLRELVSVSGLVTKVAANSFGSCFVGVGVEREGFFDGVVVILDTSFQVVNLVTSEDPGPSRTVEVISLPIISFKCNRSAGVSFNVANPSLNDSSINALSVSCSLSFIVGDGASDCRSKDRAEGNSRGADDGDLLFGDVGEIHVCLVLCGLFDLLI